MTNIFGTKRKATDFFTQLEYREGQRKTIEQIEDAFNRGKGIVILEAPTGSGKSRIAEAFARQANNTYILTPQKILQDQYERDLVGKDIKIVKGRREYKCLQSDGNCDVGLCKRESGILKAIGGEMKTFPKKCAKCPYHCALRVAKESPITIHNFDSFYYQRDIEPRELLIVDECHNIESKYLNFISLSFSDKKYLYLENLPIPDYKTLEEYDPFLKELENYLSEQKDFLEDKRDNERDYDGKKIILSEEESKKLDFCKSNLSKLERFFSSRKTGGKWIHKFFEDKKCFKIVEFKPLFVQPWIRSSLFPMGKHILMMSATICDPEIFAESIGLENMNEIEFIREDSYFPIENHSIVKRNVGLMSYKKIDESLPKLISGIEKILAIHPNQKGIIQTHTEPIANFIREHLDDPRLTFNKKFDIYKINRKTPKDTFLEHKEKKNSVIVASGLREGIDLKEELSEFQIICKVPYLDLGDKRIREKKDMDQEWYRWMSTIIFIQMLGRSVRSKDDKVITYILDSCFSYFYIQNKRFFPPHLQKIISDSFFKNKDVKTTVKPKIKKINVFELVESKKFS